LIKTELMRNKLMRLEGLPCERAESGKADFTLIIGLIVGHPGLLDLKQNLRFGLRADKNLRFGLHAD
jgi:hypothetical protein